MTPTYGIPQAQPAYGNYGDTVSFAKPVQQNDFHPQDYVKQTEVNEAKHWCSPYPPTPTPTPN
jgi:hypothetical protein